MHERGEAVALVSVHGRARASGGCARLAGAAGAGKSNESENEVCDCCEFFHAPGLSNGRAILIFPGRSEWIDRSWAPKLGPGNPKLGMQRSRSEAFCSCQRSGNSTRLEDMRPGLPSGVSGSGRIEQILSAFERRRWSPSIR